MSANQGVPEVQLGIVHPASLFQDRLVFEKYQGRCRATSEDLLSEVQV